MGNLSNFSLKNIRYKKAGLEEGDELVVEEGELEYHNP